MLNENTRKQAGQTISALLPNRANDIERIHILAESGALPVVTVIGKYNHGKSRLLNELIGNDTFAVADKRETVKLSEYVGQNVRWLDAPGLDADISTQDDLYAEQAIWLKADIRLVVHSAKEGELDQTEQALLETLRADSQKTQRQTLFILSQIDQLADQDQLQQISTIIQRQAPDMGLHAVSSTRHRQGVEQEKKLLIEKSGIPALKDALAKALNQVPQARQHEATVLFNELNAELEQRQQQQERSVNQLQQTQAQQAHAFEVGLIERLDKAQEILTDILNETGVDHSLIPDATSDILKLTTGKIERSRLQIAYSRACIQISAFLAQHGATALPEAQKTAAVSLNTVMVAVMGVSVKLRKDLHNIFFTDAGRARLCKDFTHYYELSDDRVALAQEIQQAEKALLATKEAQQAVKLLEAAHD